MNKSLLIQTLIENGIVPSRSVVGLYPQMLTTLSNQIKQNISADSSTSGQVSENTNKINTVNAKVTTLTTDLAATSVQVEANADAIAANTNGITENKTAIQQANTNIEQNASDIQTLQTKVNNLTDTAATHATKTEVQTVQSNVDANTTAINNLNTDLIGYKASTNTTLNTHTTDIADLQSAVESLEELKADVEKVNENAQKINDHAAQYEALVSTVEGIQSIKADVDSVQAAKADIQTNLNNIAANTNAISALTTRVTTAETNIASTQSDVESLDSDLTDVKGQVVANKLSADAAFDSLEAKDEELTTGLTNVATTVAEQSVTLGTHGSDILQLKQDVIAARNIADANATALTTKASVADVNAVSIVAEAAQTQANANQINVANNTAAIGSLQETVATKLATDTFNNEIVNYAKKSELPDLSPYIQTSKLSGLVAVDGVNASIAEHLLKTTKNGKVNTARVWNESDGGGVQFDSRSNQTLSFVGCNDGSDGIDVQLYAKKFYDNKNTEGHNVGSRIALSINGAFYTKNKNNGSYTANDEIATLKDLPSVEGLASETYVNNKVNSLVIPSIAGLATEEYVDNKVGAIVIPSIEGLASETFVNTAISNIEIPSIEGLATETYVNNKVNSLVIPSIEGLASVNYVDSKVASIEIPSISGLATEQYVDDAISNIYIPPIDGLASVEYVDVKVANLKIPSIEGLASTQYVDNKVAAIEIPSVEGLASESYVNTAIANIQLPDTTGFIKANNLSGLVAVDGTNVSKAEHVISTVKSGKTNKAILWNETSGGGVQFNSRSNQTLSFVGCNDGSDGIDVQIYAKKYYDNISTSGHNVGARIAVSTNGAFYTKNKSNGSYTANDELVTIKDLPDVSNFATVAFVNSEIGKIEVPSIEGLATTQYVDNKVGSIIVPSIEGLASTTYVDEKVAAIQHPTEGLATIDYVDSKVDAIQHPVEGLATETYVNNAISNIEIPSVDGFIKATNLSGLVAVDGTNVTKAEHSIVTKKNNKNITAKLWNETSGGGAQMKNENAGKISFVGVNNGDGDNEIWVQQYAKVISTNIGARTTLSTDGFFYTKNQNNGSYTANDEVVTKKDLVSYVTSSDLSTAIANIQIPSIEGLATETYVNNAISAINIPDTTGLVASNKLSGLVAVDGINVTKSEHNIVTKENDKNVTAKIWNETSGGGAQLKNENVGKISFVGVNNGNGDNEIWVQAYAKKTSDNVGTRMTLTTEKMYYTKNQANGSYTDNDEIVTVKDLTAAIANIELPSITGLATEQYVNDAIAAIEHPTVDLTPYVQTAKLNGLVSVDGVNVAKAEHSIITKKNNKNITAKIWNETSGGGSQMKNEDVGKISFIGVNNGDGDNEIWVQGYAKNISNNTGTRMTLSTTGMYYTKNQANGSYTANDEIVTKKMLSGLVAVEGTNATSAEHTIVTTKNDKTITAKLWNETSGGGAQMVNLNADKMSFVGVNNGDGDNEIWVQQYAKVKSTNVGARTTLSTTGFFYTKDQNNGSYTANDEVVTKKDLAALLTTIQEQAAEIAALKEALIAAGVISTIEGSGENASGLEPNPDIPMP